MILDPEFDAVLARAEWTYRREDLPAGYRWAREDEMDREDAIVVQRTFDSTGQPYTQGEADIAVPS